MFLISCCHVVARTTHVELAAEGTYVFWSIGNFAIVAGHLLRPVLNITNTAVVIAAFILVFTHPRLLVEADKYG